MKIPKAAKNIVLREGIPYVKDIKPEKKSFSLMENIFSNPILYTLKQKFCSKANPYEDMKIAKYLKGKVLSVGCGNENLHFNDKLPKELVGFDISPEFIQEIQKRPGFYYVGSADKIPFPDNYFDTSLIIFVLHHLPFDMKKAIKEVKRVTKKTIIIYDHKLNNNFVKRIIQLTYWKIFDSGKKYNTKKEWHKLLKDFNIKYENYTGVMFDNISQFILEK